VASGLIEDLKLGAHSELFIFFKRSRMIGELFSKMSSRSYAPTGKRRHLRAQFEHGGRSCSVIPNCTPVRTATRDRSAANPS